MFAKSLKIRHFLLVLFFFSQPLLAAGPDNFLKTYSEIHSALAADKVSEGKTLALKAHSDLSAGLKDLSSTELAHLQKMEQGAQLLSQSQNDEGARKAFGVYSEGAVSLIRTKQALQKTWQLFFCPMVPKGTYGYWIQPKNKSLLNPYYGAKMLTCGVKRPW